MKVRRGNCKCVILQTLPLYYKLTLCSSDDPIYFIHWLTCKLLEKTLRFWAPCPRNVCRKDWLNQKLFWWSISKMVYYEKYQSRRTGLERMVKFFLAGRPEPRVRWFQSGLPLIDHVTSEVSSGSTVTSSVLLNDLERTDNGLLLTCQAQNNNISKPVQHSVTIKLNRKFIKRILFLER